MLVGPWSGAGSITITGGFPGDAAIIVSAEASPCVLIHPTLIVAESSESAFKPLGGFVLTRRVGDWLVIEWTEIV